MNPDEEAKKKLDDQYAQLKKYIEEYWNDEINKQIWMNGVWDTTNTSTRNNPPQQTVSKWSHIQMYGYGISPTDVDAKGHYPYQEPERDEQGTFYGYKILRWSSQYDCFQSPRYPARWTNGELTANRVPNEYSMIGIHCTKRMDHPELGNYGNIYSEDYFLVRCALSGDVVVETEQGFRAHHAQITEVLVNGNWTSYQNFYERACPRPRRVTEEKRRGYWTDWNGEITARYSNDSDS